MNTVTRFLLAAAHLNNDIVYRDIKKVYIDKNLKSMPPEIGVDMPLLIDEAKKGRKRLVGRNVILLCIVAVIIFAVGISPLHLVIGFTIAWIVELYLAFAQRSYVVQNFLPLRDYSETQEQYISSQNLIVSGGFSPFLGSGKNVSAWSFAIDLTKSAAKSEETRPVTMPELYTELDASMDNLEIESLVSADQLFIFGSDIEAAKIDRENNSVPKTTVNQDTIDLYKGTNSPLVRHYKVYRVPFSDGELVLSVYMRFAKIGKYLFVESTSFLLPPLYDELKTLQNVRAINTAKQFVVIVATAFLKAIVNWLIALFWLASKVGDILKHIQYHVETREAKSNPRYNFGWNESLRERWSKAFFDKYFQVLDNDMFLKIMEKRILDSIIDSLSARGISTEVLQERQNLIINEGVMVTGGSLSADSLTVGKGAKSSYKYKFGFRKGGRNVQETTQ